MRPLMHHYAQSSVYLHVQLCNRTTVNIVTVVINRSYCAVRANGLIFIRLMSKGSTPYMEKKHTIHWSERTSIPRLLWLQSESLAKNYFCLVGVCHTEVKTVWHVPSISVLSFTIAISPDCTKQLKCLPLSDINKWRFYVGSLLSELGGGDPVTLWVPLRSLSLCLSFSLTVLCVLGHKCVSQLWAPLPVASIWHLLTDFEGNKILQIEKILNLSFSVI